MAHSIGKTIVELRKGKGWTQAQLAEKLSVTDKAVSKWESEAGMPEISQLPALANLFNVSLDYLMTGKAPEEKIITMSKAELCAKNDDVSMLENIDFYAKDENGKSIYDYVVQYESLKVFVAIAEKEGANKFNLVDAIKLAILSNRLDLLNRKTFNISGSTSFTFNNEFELFSLLPKKTKSTLTNRDRFNYSRGVYVLPDSLFELIVSDERINNNTLDFLFGKKGGIEKGWYKVIPQLIHYAYILNRQTVLENLLSIVANHNQAGFDKYGVSNDGCEVLKQTGGYAWGDTYAVEFAFVSVSEETIKESITRLDIDYLEKLNKINTDLKLYRNGAKVFAVAAREIEIYKHEANPSYNRDKLKEEKCVYGKIIDVDQVLATNDYKFIEKMFNKYPFTEWEIFIEYCNKKEWRKLFELLVDNKMSTEWLIEFLTESAKKKELFNYIPDWKSSQYFDSRNNKHLSTNSNGLLRYFNSNGLLRYLNELPEAVAAKKKELLAEVKLQQEYHKTTDDITKEYLLEQLNNGAFETVIIKLCVKLEGILKAKFHLEGDFYTMLSEWHEKYGYSTYDDGWGYGVTEETKEGELLQKLRIHRNGLVHPEESKERLTLEEIKQCIDIVCEMA